MLTLDQIRSVTCGAVSVGASPEDIRFYRFTRQQKDLYKTEEGYKYYFGSLWKEIKDLV